MSAGAGFLPSTVAFPNQWILDWEWHGSRFLIGSSRLKREGGKVKRRKAAMLRCFQKCSSFETFGDFVYD